MDLGLRGRSYIVTGASRGLGRAAAQALVDDGANVVISGRTAQQVERAATELGPGAVGVVADNADPQTPQLLIDRARQEFGRLDGLLVSVGGPPTGAFNQIDDRQWRDSFETVFLGAVRLVRAATPVLEPGAAIALVLSSSVRSPIANLTLSNGFRPGLAMLVKQLADELGPSGVRAMALVPGRISTERTAELDARDPDARRRSEAAIPLRRLGEPAEFGRVAAFVLSPAASYLTGSMVIVDGGGIRAL
jgi:3-oxoacyl-[acyl-carrier protein] reductase